MSLSHSSLTTQLQLVADANKRLAAREQDAETDPNSDGGRWASVVRLVCCVAARPARRRCLLLPPPPPPTSTPSPWPPTNRTATRLWPPTPVAQRSFSPGSLWTRPLCVLLPCQQRPPCHQRLINNGWGRWYWEWELGKRGYVDYDC